MLIPKTQLAVLLLLTLSMVCWAAWTSTYKAARKWRYELFYYDFAWGVVIAAVIAAFTLGSWDQKDLTFQDNFLLTGYRKMAWALGSGAVFNIANLFLLASVAVSGISVAFPITFGVTWALGAVWLFITRSEVNPTLAFGGAATMLVAVILNGLAYRWHLTAEEHKTVKALRADPRSKKAPPKTSAARGIILAVIAGVFMSVFFPAIAEATSEENGVSSYGAMLLIAAGMFASTIVLVPFFLNFPVQGEPIQVRRYFKGSKGQHLLGVLGGFIWTAAMLALMVTEEAEGVRTNPLVVYALTHAWPVLAAVLGFVLWREFSGTVQRVWMMLAAVFVLFLAGLGMIAFAPAYGG